MTDKSIKPLRCAIYTRKSTEHGLELEFNSLDAQREASEAYIKSQMHMGWKVLPARYDDPAFSGGHLDRPALQRLLHDIDAGRIDVVVVYKIDRLTRSLADFAKLVDAFDKKSISFVAVTQQFNTTTSMGRLTLNVLLSFAQFERELSSERVRDKVAASRKKGKWTGGSVPLGYDAIDKKLVVNEPEAEIVRTIYRRYLELKNLTRLLADLIERKIVTKQRTSSAGRHTGGVRLTYGPLAYLFKNRTYLGETGHKGSWFPGEHAAIVDPALFSAVQNLLKSNSVSRRQQRSDSQSLLSGLLFDDRSNRMSPSFTTKRGVRYRFYVSAAILSGRREQGGSITRISAPELENSIVVALRQRFPHSGDLSDQDLVSAHIERITICDQITQVNLKTSEVTEKQFELVRPQPPPSPRARIEFDDSQPARKPDAGLIDALARAHMWREALCDGTYQSIEQLAAVVKWNPKVVRKVLRLAFLAPDITEAIIFGSQPKSLSVSELQGVSAYSWNEQRRLLGFPLAA
jgi:site-specific DNA recombinase